MLAYNGWAQIPVVSKVTPSASASTQKVVITGSGFSNTPAQLQVWFDHVPGTVLASTEFSIDVLVPPQSRFSNVEVINLTSGLSGKSPFKFSPQYGGTDFDATKVSAPVTTSDASELFDICSCDLDLDGKPDLATTKSDFTGTPSDLMILKNKSTIGTLSFTKTDKSTLPALNVSAPTANVVCGDLNGDGKPDLVASRNGATKNQIFVLRNTNSAAGTLAFANAQSFFLDVGQTAFKIVIRDLNMDGKPELIVTNAFDDSNSATDNSLYVFVNQSSASAISFGATPIKLPLVGANTSYGLDVQDLDGDSKPEIIANQFNTDHLFVFRNLSTGQVSFAASQKITATGNFNSMTSADLDLDGLNDLILTSTFTNSVQIFINQSTAGAISFKAPQILTTSLGPWGAEISDLDGDGDADLVVTNRNEAKLNVFRQGPSLAFTKLDIPTSKPSRNLRVGDYDGDGKPDIAFTSFSGLQFSVDVIRNANCFSPKILNPAPVTICTGQTIQLTATPSPGATFDWKKSGVSFQSGANAFADITTPDSYTVTATSEVGACTITSAALAVANNVAGYPADPAIGSNSPVCVGSDLALTTAAVAGGTYQWSGPNGFTSTAQNPSVPGVKSLNAGLYSLRVAIGPCSSNTISKTLDVAIVPVPGISSSSLGAACQGATVSLSIVNTPGYTYQWLKNAVAIAGQTTNVVAVTQEGDYSVIATRSSPSCSQESGKSTLILLTPPAANFQTTATVCLGTASVFTDQSIFDARATVIYAWDFGDNNTSALKNPSNTYAAAGPYNSSLTVGYAGVSGCSNAIIKPISVAAAVVPVITSAANPICAGESTTLSVAGTFNSIDWNGAGTGSTLIISKPGDYTVKTKDVNNCPSSGAITITLKPAITLTVTADKTSINIGETVQLLASGADIFKWSPVSYLDKSDIANPVSTPISTITYQVKGQKSNFCDAVDSVKINVNRGNSLITPPPIFSPNGDGINDHWKILETDLYPDCTMSIYDGHGSKIYEQKGYNSSSYWDGRFNGGEVPDGTYFYVFVCPDAKSASGAVLVVR